MAPTQKVFIMGACSLICLVIAPFFGAAELTEQIFFLRLPRALLAWLAGGSLAIAGLILQSILRNDLATPFTLGMASAASFGAFLCIAIPSISIAFWAPQVLGFGMAIIALWFLVFLQKKQLGPNRLILAGITINFLFGAALMIIRYLAPPYRVAKLEHWLMGSIEASSYAPSFIVAFAIIFSLLISKSLMSQLDQYSFDMDVASVRGVNISKLIKKSLLISAILTTAVVTQCGPIAFIGLIVPHITRRVLPANHHWGLSGSWWIGSGFLVLADTLSRSVSFLGNSSDIPVGILTALIGGPTFLIILIKNKHFS